jgi:ABC-type nitrate/sulfonate/bicarbonate transport system permease component
MGIKRVLKQLAPAVLTLAAFVLSWEAVAASGFFSAGLFPGPGSMVRALASMLASGELAADAAQSLQRVAVGFAAGSCLGVVFGILTGRVRILERTIGQLVQVLRPVPVIALVPLAIVWFGLGEQSKYFLISWGVFFPVWVNTHIGVSRVESTLIWAAKSLGASDIRLLYEVVLPHAAPFVVAGARIGIAMAFIVLVAAEMAGAFGGIGYRISESHLVFRVDKMLAGIAMLGVLGAAADALFARLAAALIPWAARKEQEA